LAVSEFDAWIGRFRESRAVLDPWPVQALSATLGIEQPESDALPCLWHWLYFLETAPRQQIGVDGHPRQGDFTPPFNLPRRMFAGGRTTVIKPLRVGAEAGLTETILKVEQKRAGDNPLYLMTLGFDYAQEGDICIREERDIVYLGGKPAPTTAADEVVLLEGAEPWALDMTPDPVMLMRFSALTFNSHRIHYDTDYVKQEEGYPERLVHGPLTAMLLAQLASAQTDRALAGFSFRAQNPLFVNAPVRLRGGPGEGRAAALTAYTPQGKPAMTATVTLAD
jgi:3-methylfumaryl-CoA hydratase